MLPIGPRHHVRDGAAVVPTGRSTRELRWQVRDGRVAIGRGTYGVPAIILFSSEDRVVIGNYCSISGGCQLVAGGEHNTRVTSTFPFKVYYGQDPGATAADPARVRYADAVYKGPLVIGSDVWIGLGAVILSGVTVGHGAVIGACAVVASDVPPYAIVVGNPARVIRHRFPDDVVAGLLRARWWDWHPDRVAEYQPLLQGDPRLFLEAVDRVPADLLPGFYGPDPAADAMEYRKVGSPFRRPLALARAVGRGLTPPYLARLLRGSLAPEGGGP